MEYMQDEMGSYVQEHIISSILHFQGGEKLGKEPPQLEQLPSHVHAFFSHDLEILQDAEPWEGKLCMLQTYMINSRV